MKHFKSTDFVLNLIALLSSLFLIILSLCCSQHRAHISVGIVLLILNVINFVEYFKRINKKQRKEESASAKLKFKGE